MSCYQLNPLKYRHSAWCGLAAPPTTPPCRAAGRPRSPGALQLNQLTVPLRQAAARALTSPPASIKGGRGFRLPVYGYLVVFPRICPPKRILGNRTGAFVAVTMETRERSAEAQYEGQKEAADV
ncbi:hypothetical protein MHYP_G00348310 [Metynnis hypsauchen]